MPQLRITLRDLVGFPAGSTELQGPALEKWVREQFSFLPQPMEVHLEKGEAILTYPAEPESSQAEATRLAQKASKRAGTASPWTISKPSTLSASSKARNRRRIDGICPTQWERMTS